MDVCFGGTFNVLHRGHKVLIDRAFFEAGNRGHVHIGIMGDGFASKGRKDLRPYASRRASMFRYLKRKGHSNHTILKIDSTLGRAVDGDYDKIIVSDETVPNAKKINQTRKRSGLKALKIINIGRILAQDGLPISSTRVLKGQIDKEGRIRGAVQVRVGSANPVKVTAAQRVMGRIFKGALVKGVKVPSGVSEQPKGHDTIQGSINRAKEAIGKAHYGIGIEAGVFHDKHSGKWLDIQYCAVVDRGGRMTLGHGSGFQYPDAIMEKVNEGKTVNTALTELYGLKDAGKNKGAIGYLTYDILDRTSLTEQAVLAAMVPRIRSDAYE